MSPYDDPHVSAGEIADYLHSQQSEIMSFTSPPDLAKLGLPQTLAQPLTKPDTSADVIRPRRLGTVNCINVARLGEPVTLRYFGASALCSATGQAHPTQEQAEADVLAWADGKPVAYEQHAVVPLSCMATCTKKPAQLAQNLLPFGTVVEAAKGGRRIARLGWNGKGMWLVLFSQSFFVTVDIEEGEVEPGQPIDIDKHGYSAHIGDAGSRIEHIGLVSTDSNDFYPISDFFLLKTADNKCVPWNASQSDTLAEDWVILPR